jgi:L-malate glycosyltransferase
MIKYVTTSRRTSNEMSSAERDAIARLRVAQVVPTLTVGGAEKLAMRLTLRLMDRAESVFLCSAGGEPFEPVLRDVGARLEMIPRPRQRPLALARASLALARILRRERPDVIHAHNPLCGVVSALARLLARQPQIAIVTTYHGLLPRRHQRAARALAASSDVVVGVSPAATSDLAAGGFPVDQVATIPNGIDMNGRVEPTAVRAEFDLEEAELLVSVGRYVEEKDYPTLVEAVGLLISKHPRLRALIVGEGSLDRALQKKIDDAGLEKIVKLTGLRKDAIDITSAADVFVLSSVSEGLPLALLEAMAHGRAVVATRAGGTSDVIADGESGILVPMENPSALAEAIGRVLDDPILRTRLGEAGRTYVARFHSEDTMLGGYEELYLEAVAKRASRARR